MSYVRLRKASGLALTNRFLSRLDEAPSRTLAQETLLWLRALFGSSRVREDLPRCDPGAGFMCSTP